MQPLVPVTVTAPSASRLQTATVVPFFLTVSSTPFRTSAAPWLSVPVLSNVNFVGVLVMVPPSSVSPSPVALPVGLVG